jgi:hypothetical protein
MPRVPFPSSTAVPRSGFFRKSCFAGASAFILSACRQGRTWAPGSPGYSPGLGPASTCKSLLNFQKKIDSSCHWA